MIGIVADDVTGANDIGLMYAKHGYKVEVFSVYQELDLRSIQADVIVLDTNSRADEPAVAYEKVFAATKKLLPLNCRLLTKKTCSVFRGNVGSEFDAMLDAAKKDFAVVIAAFPKNGRITKEGIHYVHGKILSESEFAQDPIHPMTKDDLREIVVSQSRRPVSLLNYRVVAKGVTAVRNEVEKYRSRGGYLIVDSTSQDDLKTVARALAEEPLIFGSSALAEELPKFWGPPQVGLIMNDLPRNSVGTLMVAGSVTPQTKSQVRYLREQGFPVRAVDTRRLFAPKERAEEIDKAVSWASSIVKSGRPALVYGRHEPKEIEETLEAALRAGFSKIEANRLVSCTLGEITRRIVEMNKVKRLVVAGGETSNDVCRSLGIIGNLVLKEIQPGLPSGLSRGRNELLVVLKSGSFGTPDFLVKALEHLEGL